MTFEIEQLFPFQLTLAIAVSVLVFVNARTTVLEAIQIAKSVPDQMAFFFSYLQTDIYFAISSFAIIYETTSANKQLSLFAEMKWCES